MWKKIQITLVVFLMCTISFGAAPAGAYYSPDDSRYYAENYRPQYHITPASGWLNDPNGLVYYQGVYHAFYQYDPNTKFPGMDKWWAHVTSTDLVHWEWQGVALAPDNYGSMWSGSALADPRNDSGLFGPEGGLLAFYTVATNTSQQQCLAYSSDSGATWQKYQDGAPIITSADDPAHSGDFRDPKVFYLEEAGQYLMVVAGGPVRLYASEDLIHWTFQSYGTYANGATVYTECPDLFSLAVDGNPKDLTWVLSTAGTGYLTGSLTQQDGIWKFTGDSNQLKPFNYGPDVYAGQTFSGTGDRRIMLEWMVNIGYSYNTGNITDPYAGALTLPYELAAQREGEEIVLRSSPVQELSVLRTGAVYEAQDLTLTPDSANPLADLQLDTCEIVTIIDPGTAEEIALKLHVGMEQETVLRYNTVTEHLTLDRGRSGLGESVSNTFLSSYSAHVAGELLELHLFLDRSSLEVFAQDGRYPITCLTYSDPAAVGLELSVADGAATVQTMTVYSLDSIYREPIPGELSSFTLSPSATTCLVGDRISVWAVAQPFGAGAPQVEWMVSDPEVLQIVAQQDGSIQLQALAPGSCKLYATPTVGRYQSVEITVVAPEFRTNVTGWHALQGDFHITAQGYAGSGWGGNCQTFSGVQVGNFTYEATFTYTAGTVGTALIFRASPDLTTYYTADINLDSCAARILRFTRNPDTGNTSDITLGEPYYFVRKEIPTYTLRVEANGDILRFYLDGQLAVEVTDSASSFGYLGLNLCNVAGVFQDVQVISYDPEPPDSLGDLNGDGNLSVTDVVLLRKAILQNGTAGTYPAGDLNEDGVLSVTDVVLLRKKILNQA